MSLQSRRGLSSERLGDIAGGKVVYDDHWKEWEVRDNDDDRHVFWAKTKEVAEDLDNVYHTGKNIGRAENRNAFERGYALGMRKGVEQALCQQNRPLGH